MPSEVSRDIVQVVLRDSTSISPVCSEVNAVGRGQRHEFDLGRIVENRRRDGAAEVDVEADPIALRIGHAEAGQCAVRAADELAAILHRLERLRGRSLRAESENQCEGECRSYTFHDMTHDFSLSA